ARFLRNSAQPTGGSSYFTGQGYLVYGLPTPSGSLSLSNVASVLSGTTPNPNDTNIAYENGTDVVSNVDVITSDNFSVTLNTIENNIPGFGHWHNADGDVAQIKIDGGIDVTGGGLTTDPNSVSYGFENFATVNSPGYSANAGAGGDGTYSQNISSSQLGQGYHYIDVIAFSHNSDPSAPPVYTDWRQTIYIDTAPANSTILSFDPTVAGVTQNRQINIQSVDGLSNNIHVFLDLPFGLTDAQVLSDVNSSNQASNTDINVWQQAYNGVTSGNHTITLVSYKPDGSYSIQRFNSLQMPFLATTTSVGAGIGDVNYDGLFNSSDITSFNSVLTSNNTLFRPSADVNGDGYVNLSDAFLLGPILASHNVSSSTWNFYNAMLSESYVTSGTYTVSGSDTILQDTAGTTNLGAGASLVATYVRGSVLKLAMGASVKITQNGTSGGTSKIGSLSMAGSMNHWQGQIDLANNDLIIDYTAGNDPIDDIANMLRQGYDNALWDGQGIISSLAAQSNGIITLGYADTATFPLYSLGGQSADTTCILIKYTYVGDANLDGKVDANDLAMITPGGTTWTQGDFNYDGVVNGDDYALFAFGLAEQQGQLTQLPEPNVTFMSLVAGGLLSIRRRRDLECKRTPFEKRGMEP
ncbi:MAG TPA: dockerin type I domain-containing protein, partial [Tepidisphaeraceae bacterium]|nr:dockerin type I domain-containing protein [Tepidisphaeraceae bacterium]